jgi:hypothetical protein
MCCERRETGVQVAPVRVDKFGGFLPEDIEKNLSAHTADFDLKHADRLDFNDALKMENFIRELTALYPRELSQTVGVVLKTENLTSTGQSALLHMMENACKHSAGLR